MKSLVKVAMVVLILATVLMLPAGVSAQVEDWSVPLAITSAIGSVDVTFGVNSLATDGFDDDYDKPAPPPPMEGVEAYFDYPDNPLPGTNKLATSIIAPADSVIWPLKVRYITSGEAGEVTITWEPGDIDSVPGKYLTLELQDESGNKLADMRAQTSYTFTVEPYLPYSFQIKAEVAPVVIAISVEPTSVDFGAITAGHSSDPRTVTVTNIGNVAEDFSATLDNISEPDVYTDGLTIDGSLVADWLPTGVAVDGTEAPELILTVPPATPASTHTATLIFWAEATGP